MLLLTRQVPKSHAPSGCSLVKDFSGLQPSKAPSSEGNADVLSQLTRHQLLRRGRAMAVTLFHRPLHCSPQRQDLGQPGSGNWIRNAICIPKLSECSFSPQHASQGVECPCYQGRERAHLATCRGAKPLLGFVISVAPAVKHGQMSSVEEVSSGLTHRLFLADKLHWYHRELRD